MAQDTLSVYDRLRYFWRVRWSPSRPVVTRDAVERRERLMLSPFAAVSADSLGRKAVEPPCLLRTDFARDRDRIIHSKAFMSLSGKTQVLPMPESPYIHTRLFHVMKVAQIARDICRALGLNEDLAEAIALGHDLGHSPFGHEGERVLDALSRKDLGTPFKHNRHSLRVVDKIEKLNLTFEVRDGILRHDGEKKDAILRPSESYFLSDAEFPTTLEGCVVRIADRIAYLPVDLEDALKLGVIAEGEIPEAIKRVLGTSVREMIDTLVRDVVASSAGKNYITMSQEAREAMDALFEFNYAYYYYGKFKAALLPEIERCITTLYDYCRAGLKMSPREAIDHIASLTDKQARDAFREITKLNLAGVPK